MESGHTDRGGLCDARLAAVASVQHGVFTREQAIASGLSPGQVDYQLRSRRWRRVLPRVYRAREQAAGRFGAPLGRRLVGGARRRALAHDRGSAVAAAGRAVRYRGQRAAPPSADARGECRACIAPQHFDAADVQQLRGLPVTTPLRTLVDLATILDDRAFAAALEAASGRGLVSVAAASQRRLFRAATKRWRRCGFESQVRRFRAPLPIRETVRDDRHRTRRPPRLRQRRCGARAPARRQRRPHHPTLRRADRGHADRGAQPRQGTRRRARARRAHQRRRRGGRRPQHRRGRRGHRRCRARPQLDPHGTEVGEARGDRQQGAARQLRRASCSRRPRPRASTCCSRRRSRAASR